MSKERAFAPVKDTKEKGVTYAVMMKKYKDAIRSEFYYEAILIDYAFMEDRFRSALYHLGALNTRESFKVDCQKSKNWIRPIIAKYIGEKESKNLGITSITGKRKIVKALLLWREDDFSEFTGKYYDTVKKAFEKYKYIDTVLNTIEQCEKWCGVRNEIIHALLNKNMFDMEDKVKEVAEQGMAIGRELDKFVAFLKRNKSIRESLGLKTDEE